MTVPGNVPAQNATWSFTSSTSLNNLGSLVATDGERTLFIQDSADVAGGGYWKFNIFLDTAGPQVTGVTLVPSGVPVSGQTGPTPATSGLDVTFSDAAVRTADFPSAPTASNLNAPENSAVYSNLGNDPNFYTLTGAKGGIIPIATATLSDTTTGSIGPASSSVALTFANTTTLPDDTYTLTISDGLEDPAGNGLEQRAEP